MNEDHSSDHLSSQFTIRERPIAVDFIENRLPSYHSAFNTGRATFDFSQGRYVALPPPSAKMNGTVDSRPLSEGHLSPAAVLLPQQHSPRPEACDVHDMAFWREILPRAMEMIQIEEIPCPITKGSWAIRHLSTWEDIQYQLESARKHYEFSDSNKHVGWARTKVRGVLDKHVATLQQGARLVPEIDIAKPVVGAIKLVLDVSKMCCAAVRRRKVDGSNEFQRHIKRHPKSEKRCKQALRT